MTTAVVNNVDKKEQRVKNVFRVILTQKATPGFMEYAQAYAQAGLELEGEALKVQVMYVMCNLQYWRGDEARRCKKVLKEFIGGKR